MKLLRGSPCCNDAGRAASWAARAACGLTNGSASFRRLASNTFQTGIQDTPVDSSAT
jgi:hypothetical protein